MCKNKIVLHAGSKGSHTLELLFGIFVLGILASVAYPKLSGTVETATYAKPHNVLTEEWN
jgi:Tfp pilus assembly protein FimT